MKLGRSDFDVSRIGLGGNTFGWTSDETASHAVLDAYVAGGGNFIDTADGYSAWADGHVGGESEAVIGTWLEGRGSRDDVVIATKVATKPDRTGLAPDNVRTALRESLERLRTDHVDLYYAHFDDPDTPLEQTVAAFEELRSEGLTRYVAVSNYTPERLTEWLAIADDHGYEAPVALQPHYNLLHRGDVEGPGNRGEIAERAGMGLVPYFSLAAGFLTGKYHEGEPVTSERAGMVSSYLNAAAFTAVDVLREVAQAHATEPAAVALAWLRDRPGVVAPLASARSVDQLRPILQALTLELEPEETERLTAASDTAAAAATAED